MVWCTGTESAGKRRVVKKGSTQTAGFGRWPAGGSMSLQAQASWTVQVNEVNRTADKHSNMSLVLLQQVWEDRVKPAADIYSPIISWGHSNKLTSSFMQNSLEYEQLIFCFFISTSFFHFLRKQRSDQRKLVTARLSLLPVWWCYHCSIHLCRQHKGDPETVQHNQPKSRAKT